MLLNREFVKLWVILIFSVLILVGKRLDFIIVEIEVYLVRKI